MKKTIIVTALALGLSACGNPEVSNLESKISKQTELADQYLSFLETPDLGRDKVCTQEVHEAIKTLQGYAEKFIPGQEGSILQEAESISISDENEKEELINKATQARQKVTDAYNGLNRKFYRSNCHARMGL